MPWKDDFVLGKGQALYVYLLAAGSRDKPSPVTLTVSNSGSAVTAGSTSIPLSAAPGVVIPEGTVLAFGAVEVYVAQTAQATDTALTVDPTPADIPDGATATWDQLVRLHGGTNSPFQGSSNEQTTSTYESGGWQDGKVVQNSWTINWNGNFRPDDQGYKYVRDAWLNQQELYVLQVRTREDGTVAEKREGVCAVTSFQDDAPADGVVTMTATLNGRGAPTLTESP